MQKQVGKQTRHTDLETQADKKTRHKDLETYRQVNRLGKQTQRHIDKHTIGTKIQKQVVGKQTRQISIWQETDRKTGVEKTNDQGHNQKKVRYTDRWREINRWNDRCPTI